MKILFRISNSPEGVRMEKEFLYPCRILKNLTDIYFFNFDGQFFLKKRSRGFGGIQNDSPFRILKNRF